MCTLSESFTEMYLDKSGSCPGCDRIIIKPITSITNTMFSWDLWSLGLIMARRAYEGDNM